MAENFSKTPYWRHSLSYSEQPPQVKSYVYLYQCRTQQEILFSPLLLNQIIQKDFAQDFCTPLAAWHIWKLNWKLSPATSELCRNQDRRIWFAVILPKADLQINQNLCCRVTCQMQSSAPPMKSTHFAWLRSSFQCSLYLANVQEESKSQQTHQNVYIA